MGLSLPSFDVERSPLLSTHNIVGGRYSAFHSPTTPPSTAWPVANQAFLIPFTVSFQITYTRMFFNAGTTPGTTAYDLGIYRSDFTRLGSIGATAAVSTSDAILPVGGGLLTSPVSLPRGRYYLAMSSAATTLTVHAYTQGNQFVRALGVQTAASAHPLPATITPASMSTTAFVPVIGALVSANLVL